MTLGAFPTVIKIGKIPLLIYQYQQHLNSLGINLSSECMA